jgi:hypothetical protein
MDNRGKNNPNWKHGKYATEYKNKCITCGTNIDYRSIRCYKCRSIWDNAFKGKHHSNKSKKLIGIKSSAKFTENFLNSIRLKHQGFKKRSINGYILVKDYNHPNKNSHNDVFEHIKTMSNIIKRPIRKGEIVHHINFIRDDNRRINLYLYRNISEHGKCTKSIFRLVKCLLENKIIFFKRGEYKMNKRFIKRLLVEVSRVQVGGKDQ